MSQLRMRVLCAVLLCSAMACGDDDDSGKKGNDAGLLRDGGTKGGAGNGGSGGTGIGSSEQGDEGWPCTFKDGECKSGFTCVENIFADQTGKALGVCARHCQPDMFRPTAKTARSALATRTKTPMRTA